MHRRVLFDIDGTLIQDGGAARRAFDQAFEDLFDVPQASLGVDKHGRTDLRIFRDTALKALGCKLLPEEMQGLQNRYLALLPDLSDAERFKRLLGLAEGKESDHE